MTLFFSAYFMVGIMFAILMCLVVANPVYDDHAYVARRSQTVVSCARFYGPAIGLCLVFWPVVFLMIFAASTVGRKNRQRLP